MSKKSILVVDDEPGILEISQTSLEISGYQVYTALNALAALDILDREKIDLVISDLKMPVMDGLSLLQKVNEKWPDIGFILITGFWKTNSDEIEKVKDKLFSVLKKPFELAELIQLTKKYFDEQKTNSNQ